MIPFELKPNHQTHLRTPQHQQSPTQTLSILQRPFIHEIQEAFQIHYDIRPSNDVLVITSELRIAMAGF